MIVIYGSGQDSLRLEPTLLTNWTHQ